MNFQNAVKRFPTLSSSNVSKKTVPQKTPTQKQRPVSTSTITKRTSSSTFTSPLQNANNYIDKEVYLTPNNDKNEKENCSPVPSENLFDHLQMTPVTSASKLPDNRLYLDYLASLPTPTYKPNSGGIMEGLCPRKLTVEVSPEISPKMPINKTFNINSKNIPTVKISSELDVIEEEGAKLTHQPQTPFSRSKHDINLVGTPIRKYSESMRDLNVNKVGFTSFLFRFPKFGTLLISQSVFRI